MVDLGSFRGSVPVGSADLESGVVGRYAERFLAAHAEEMHGALEIGPDAASMETLAQMPDESQMSIVCVLPPGGLDWRVAVGHLHRLLRAGGTLLVVLPGVALAPYSERQDDYWRFTGACARWLFGLYFSDGLEVSHLGNAVTSLAALHRLPAESLTDEEYGQADSQYQLLVTVRARRS
jgi:hypothetical protein